MTAKTAQDIFENAVNNTGIIRATRIINEGGLIKIGGPAEPILGCPVASGKIGIAFYAGVNGVVAAGELGAKIETAPISMMVDYTRMSLLK